MRESLQDSSEDLYYTATTTDIFDFSTDTFTSAEVTFSQRSSSIFRFLRLILGSIKFAFIAVFKITFEFATFLVTYLSFLTTKFWQLIRFLDISKDQVVSTLMWRRGLLFRPATHGGVIVVAALAVVAGGLFSRGQIAAQDLTPQESILNHANTAKTIVPTNRPRSEVVTYKVIEGDTISEVAAKFGVSVDTIKWANNLSSDTITPENNLKIPPVTGIVYTVKKGDTLNSVASKYSADKQTIADFPFNYIDDSFSLRVGQILYIPNGQEPQPAAPAYHPYYATYTGGGSGFLSWPVPRMISQYFSWFHQALDLADPYGTPIYASIDGTIIDARKQTYSFGWYCIEDAGNGWTVAYAHMSAQACYVGQHVARGQYIGNVGATGFATGPHLHFEVRHYGVGVNPLTLLP